MGMALRSAAREFQLLDGEGRRVEASNIKMNKKADKKLAAVADMFWQVLEDKCEITDSDMLFRRLKINELLPLYDIMLMYDVENRFASISYNLLLQTVVTKEERNNYHFELKIDGILKAKNMRFEADNKARPLDQRETQILELLNHPVIIKKIKQLGLINVSLGYQMEYGRWLISVKSMAGSSTWILMPPVMQVIMPERREIYRFTELMRMLCSVVGGDRY